MENNKTVRRQRRKQYAAFWMALILIFNALPGIAVAWSTESKYGSWVITFNTNTQYSPPFQAGDQITVNSISAKYDNVDATEIKCKRLIIGVYESPQPLG